MAAPAYQDSAQTTDWTTVSVPPKVTGNLTAATNDVIVCLAATSTGLGTDTLSVTGSGVTLSAQQQSAVASCCQIEVSAGVVASGGTVYGSILESVNSYYFGGIILRFNGSDGVGNSGVIATPASQRTASFDVTTTQANSAIAFIFADWNALDPGAISESFSQINGASPTVLTPIYMSNEYTAYFGYYADAGAIGTKTITFDAGSGNSAKASGAGVEVKGTAGGGPSNTLMGQVCL